MLGLVQVLFAGALVTHQRGIAWNLSNRDGEIKSVSGPAARAERGSHNFLETFPFFAAAALAVVLAKASTSHTELGAEVYLAARIAYFPIYVVGIPYLRTVVYGISLWGILQMVEPFLKL